MADRKTGFLVLQPGVPADPQAVAWVDLPAEPSGQQLKEIVLPFLGGGQMEHVSVLHQGERRCMFVDEDGIDKGLPRNDAATAIYRNNSLTRSPGTDPESLPAVYGTAVLFLRRVWF